MTICGWKLRISIQNDSSKSWTKKDIDLLKLQKNWPRSILAEATRRIGNSQYV